MSEMLLNRERALNASASSLQTLVWPEAIESFLKERWTRDFAVYNGESGRFRSLFSWTQLNRVLQEHAFRVPRLRLFKDGRAVDPTAYMEMGPGREPRIKSAGIQCAMDDGATLILDHVHELSRPLTHLRLDLERTFRAPVNINLYASTRATKGFALHWDDHEVLALQVEGRKQWTIYKPTVVNPTVDMKASTPPPTDPPVFDRVLSDGEVLYMPRGWWHLACSIDEPSLHLTIGIVPLSGIDLLHWAVNRLKTNETARKSLPIFGQAEEMDAFLNELQVQVGRCLADNSIDEYMAVLDKLAVGTTVFNLPSSSNYVIRGKTIVRLLSARIIRSRQIGTPGSSA